MSRIRLRQAREWAALAALLLLTAAAFSPVLFNGFVNFDDDVYLTNNPWVSRGLSPAGVGWAFTEAYASNWHPLTWLSHMADVSMFGLNPMGHHAMNLLIHLANTAVLFVALRRMTGQAWAALAAAALFALHPLRVESVAWASERKDTLSTLFWMLALWAHAWHAERPSLARYAAVAAALALGLLAKGMLVTLPCVLLLLDYWPLGRMEQSGRFHWSAAWRCVLEKLPILGIALAAAVLTYFAQKQGGAVGSFDKFPLDVRALNAIRSYGVYLWQAVYPSGLAIFYPHPGSGISLVQVVFAAAVLTALTLLSVATIRQAPYLAVGWFWYLGTLVPVVGLVQVGEQAHADRYTYVTQIGLYIRVVWAAAAGGRRWPGAVRFLAAATAAAAIVLASLTFRQCMVWKDGESLFRHAAAVTRDNKLAWLKLGNALAAKGETEEAREAYALALDIDAGYPGPWTNLGLLALNAGRTEEALTHFRTALAGDPNHVEAHINAGIALGMLGRPGAALHHLERAAALRPGSFSAHFNLGVLHYQRGDMAKARHHLGEANLLNPFDEDVRRALGEITGMP